MNLADPPPPAGSLSNGRHLLPIRVYYEDTDFSGAVYHASYLRFLERGRTELLRAIGFGQAALRGEEGLAFVVRSVSIDFLHPSHMDDVLLVETAGDDVKAASVSMRQSISRAGQRLVSSCVLIVAVANGRACRIPTPLREKFETFAALSKRQPNGQAAEAGS